MTAFTRSQAHHRINQCWLHLVLMLSMILIGGLCTDLLTAPAAAGASTQLHHPLAPQMSATFLQQAYVKASNTDAGDLFGASLAISGDTMVIGVPEDRSTATGVDGDQYNNFAPAAGAAFVFVRTGNTWQQQAYLKASNTDAGDYFGDSVAISGDTIVVGAPREDSAARGVNGDQSDDSAGGAGAAYVFVRTGTTWQQQAYLKASNTDAQDFFSDSLAISGNTIVIGAPWESSQATGVNGNQSDNSVQYAGAAYIFVRTGTTWQQQAYLKASNTGMWDNFGGDVTIAGDTIVAGAPGEDSATTGISGGQHNNSASDAGAAYVFVRTGDLWQQQAYLKASNTDAEDYFGDSVAIADDTIVVGASREASAAATINGNQLDNSMERAGAAYVFVRTGNLWKQQAYLKASNTGPWDNFGIDLAISGNTIIAGAPWEDSATTNVNGDQNNNSAPESGAGYVFVRTGEIWQQQAYLKASNTDKNDSFGWNVAIDGETIGIGAQVESSTATGINGDQTNNVAYKAGAGYVFFKYGLPESRFLPLLRR